jgi:DNA-directed RNA polymerase delta subunit
MTIDELDAKLSGYEHPSQIAAIASISKHLSTLGGLWGLTKWPTVNPRNIRDKIFVILEENKEPMHFATIARAIAASEFKRKNVTIQAIHNELIKDSRFVLIGRGIYALNSWGYVRGTVSDMIIKVLKEADNQAPLSRQEIVKRVLKYRKVKETTILLNLQNKSLFTRVGKTTYKLANNPR